MQKIKIVFILIGILSLLLFLLYYGKGKDTGNTPLYSMIKDENREWKFIFKEKKKILLHQYKDTITTFFDYYNYTDKVQLIDTIKTSCGCTKVRYPHKPIWVGEKGKIFISIDVTNDSGYFGKTIAVYFHEQKPIMLRVLGKKEYRETRIDN
ncbi:DUF1573 domain-containing protein [Prevotella buccae]|uniref:DUF1573 domain-containing protein n=1 Tax=Segatella buccae TaxID=28126 RepID=UPI001C5EFE42|nr:DUF1573 domain-containing protein [Segatella buccae]MBW4871354.1 DUF1573 domain-containing protein [Segatella buccae]